MKWPLDYVVCHNPVDLVDIAAAWSMWDVASDPEMDPLGSFSQVIGWKTTLV